MPEDEFEIYLTLLAKTLRLKDDQRDAIAAELRDHMEARLDEATLQGVPRQQAIETALAEFGDASGLANELTRTNPQRTRTRRHLMQTTFGTIAACAAVTFAVMLLVPNNKSGQPNQPAAVAQGGAFGSDEGFEGGNFGRAGAFDDFGEGGFDEGFDEGGFGEGGFGLAGRGAHFSSPDGRIIEKTKLDLAIHVVDCTEILRADQQRGDLLKRTAALANAVEQTVATVTPHGGQAIRVQPFEEFLIITATKDAHKEAEKLLQQISEHVAKRSAIQKQIDEQQEAAFRHRAEKQIKTQAQYQQVVSELSELQAMHALLKAEHASRLANSGPEDPEADALEGEIKAIDDRVQLLRELAHKLDIEREMLQMPPNRW